MADTARYITLSQLQQRIKAAVLTDQGADGSNQDGHHGGLEHAGSAGAHVREQVSRGGLAGDQHNK